MYQLNSNIQRTRASPKILSWKIVVENWKEIFVMKRVKAMIRCRNSVAKPLSILYLIVYYDL
jgi:hypothetical protein